MAIATKKKRLTKEEKADNEILSLALSRYRECDSSCSEIYRNAIEDIKFSIGDQWGAEELKSRTSRPSLVENRISASVRQVCNAQRENRSMIKVLPGDDETDEKTAKIINGYLRYIQYNSESETAIDTAFENAVRGGIGWFRAVTDYAGEDSFDQDILIKRVPDIQSVRVPFHLCNEADFSDMPYAFVETTMTKDDFKIEYPDCDVDNWPSSVTDDGWITDEEVKVAEYFVVEKKYKKKYLLSSGEISDVKPEADSILTVEAERDVCLKSVKWYKITASEILDRKDIPSKWIPIFPVLGEDITIEGKRNFISLTRNGKDPQRMLNFWRSSEAERISLAPKAPFIAAEGQIEGNEQVWADANRYNVSVLTYKPIVEGGTLLPAPQRQQNVQMDMAIVNAARESVDAIKACTGIFDAGLGNQSNETSGRAIVARQRQGDTSNFHFFDNLAKSMRHCCRVIIDMIPKVLDTERAIKILGEDMKEDIAVVNKAYDANGEIYDLSAGKYDVIVETGPAFMSKKQETATNLQTLAQSDPVIVQSTRDLMMKYMGLPSEIVERVKKTIPPELLADENKGKADPQQVMAMAAQMQQQMAQMDQVIQQMSAENEQLAAEIKMKNSDNQTKLAVAELNGKFDVIVAQIKAQTEQEKMTHEAVIESVRHENTIEREDFGAVRNAAFNPPRPPADEAE